MSSKVTIIIPTYNRAEYLQEAVRSALDQTYDNFEVVVVDDGSTDDTRDIVASFGDAVRYLYQTNTGCATARNEGIRRAMGDYIAFLDSDDLLEPRKLEVQVPLLDSDPRIGLVYSDSWIFYDENQASMKRKSAVARSQPEDFAQKHFFSTAVHAPAVLVRQECFSDVGFFNVTFGNNEDSDMWQRIAMRWKVAFSEYPSCRVRLHDEGKSRNRIGIYRALLASSESVLEQNPEFARSLGEKVDLRLGELHFLLGIALFRDKQLELAAAEFDKAVSLAPVFRHFRVFQRTVGMIPGWFFRKSTSFYIRRLQAYLDDNLRGAESP